MHLEKLIDESLQQASGYEGWAHDNKSGIPRAVAAIYQLVTPFAFHLVDKTPQMSRTTQIFNIVALAPSTASTETALFITIMSKASSEFATHNIESAMGWIFLYIIKNVASHMIANSLTEAFVSDIEGSNPQS